MNYIVLDMEWNQPGYGDTVLCKNGICMKNEIIQIGAVRLDDRGKKGDTFSKIIKPASLTCMNKVIKSLTGITDEMLDKGESFESVIEAFKLWCGEDYVLLIWGYDDIRILKSNLKFHGLDEKWIPMHYNLQMVFCAQTGLEKRQYSLSFALEHFSICVDDDLLHDALYDAISTASVCEKLNLEDGLEKLRLMPSHEEKGDKTGNVLVKRKFRHIANREDIWVNGYITRPVCPFCGGKMKFEKPNRIGLNKIHIEGHCQNDGDFLAVIKISETPQKNFSVSQQMYILDDKMREYLSRPKTKRVRKRPVSGKRRSSKAGKTVTTDVK